MLLPPVPMLVLILWGCAWRVRKPLLGWALVLLGAAGIWASCTRVVGDALIRDVLKPPPALALSQLDAWKANPEHAQKVAVIVLGGGVRSQAPEFGHATLTAEAAARLRYGLWVASQAGLRVGYSGGAGYAAADTLREAHMAAQLAKDEHGVRLSWVEDASRDTRENAALTLPLLKAQGIEEVVLVTHDWHMPRSVRAFEQAATRMGYRVRIIPAPMDMSAERELPLDHYLPGPRGYERTHDAIHEIVGLLMGA